MGTSVRASRQGRRKDCKNEAPQRRAMLLPGPMKDDVLASRRALNPSKTHNWCRFRHRLTATWHGFLSWHWPVIKTLAVERSSQLPTSNEFAGAEGEAKTPARQAAPR